MEQIKGNISELVQAFGQGILSQESNSTLKKQRKHNSFPKQTKLASPPQELYTTQHCLNHSAVLLETMQPGASSEPRLYTDIEPQSHWLQTEEGDTLIIDASGTLLLHNIQIHSI